MASCPKPLLTEGYTAIRVHYMSKSGMGLAYLAGRGQRGFLKGLHYVATPRATPEYPKSYYSNIALY